MKRRNSQLVQLIDSGIPPGFKNAYLAQRSRVISEFLDHQQSVQRKPNLNDPGTLAVEVVQFLLLKIDSVLGEIQNLHQSLNDFNYRYNRAGTRKEMREQILHFSREMGAGVLQLWGDRRAFSRWFGHDAVIERCLKRISEKEAQLIFLLDLVGSLARTALEQRDAKESKRSVWQQINLEKNIYSLLAYSGDSRVRMHAFKCLTTAIPALTGDVRNFSLEQDIYSFIYRAALDDSEDTWIQVEALSLLKYLSVDSLETVLQKRLQQSANREDIFVRKHCILLMGDIYELAPDLSGYFQDAARDPSPFVRQGLAQATATALLQAYDQGLLETLQSLLLRDESVQVRAKALQSCARLMHSQYHLGKVLELIEKSLKREDDVFVLHTCLKSVGECAANMSDSGLKDLNTLSEHLLPMLESLHTAAQDLRVRRWSAQTREWLVVLQESSTRFLYNNLMQRVKYLPPGKNIKLPKSLYQHTDKRGLYRVLSVLAQDDYGFVLSPAWGGLRLWKGDIYVFRFWRFIFEFFNPSPYKRQGYKHTVGRTLPGRIIFPALKISELTRTHVPGEPLFISSEDGWRPYLPLPDIILSSLFLHIRPKQIRICSSEGTTLVNPPASIFKRFWAWWKLTVRFKYYAELRNWTERSNFSPNTYTHELSKLGFSFSFQGEEDSNRDITMDPEVQKFFPAILPFLTSDIWQSFQDYFFSVYGNTLYELGVFGVAVLLFFAGRRIYLNYMGRRARKQLPLVIGGWGTRGKSGTERLKTAVMEALGYSTISKTSGTESMFLLAPAMGRAREMILFRPFDKATIWEQYSMNRWAVKLRAKVLLWECMGLNPSYVSVLQKHWCRDDISTLTNAYPDHEDIQGPAGINIPLVMDSFVPENRVLISSEEQMRPVLENSARQKNTRFESTDWQEAAMIPPDVLQRFPYQEHPHNIALVLKLAQELQIDSDFALKEMADRVVPDVGVLKSFPAAVRNFRKLKFANGMAANERYATLSNWERMGFDASEEDDLAGSVQSLLVNNRADRISRSKMFASIVVEDLSTDYIVLAGTNLTGLMGFIRQAWEQFVNGYDFYQTGTSARESFYQVARHLRVPTEISMLKKRLAAILDYFHIAGQKRDNLLAFWEEPEKLETELDSLGISLPAGEIAEHMQNYLEQYRKYTRIAHKLSGKEEKEGVDLTDQIHKFLQDSFFMKIHIIEDSHASGEFIVNKFYQITPPGLTNRIMGVQNIKGPGLEFVYRWQSWETCYNLCNMLFFDSESEVKRGLRELSAFSDYGLLCAEYVQQTLQELRKRQVAQTEHFQAGLDLIEKTMEKQVSDTKEEINTASGGNRFLAPVLKFLESFLDAGDGVRRRRQANRIYRDMKNERISHDRAVQEINNLHKRQRGGWLSKKFNSLLK